MELKDFVKETIVQIVKGIDEANATLSERNAFVASSNFQTNKDIKYATDKEGRCHYVTDLDFDVAINAQKSKALEGGGGIEILSVLKLGGKSSNENLNSSTNRIKFTLPLALPTEPEK